MKLFKMLLAAFTWLYKLHMCSCSYSNSGIQPNTIPNCYCEWVFDHVFHSETFMPVVMLLKMQSTSYTPFYLVTKRVLKISKKRRGTKTTGWIGFTKIGRHKKKNTSACSEDTLNHMCLHVEHVCVFVIWSFLASHICTMHTNFLYKRRTERER